MTATNDPVGERHWACARRLRERRHQLGLTQAEVVDRAGASGAPLTNRTLSAMEHGRGLDLGRLPDLAAALECTITYLVGLTADPTRWEPDEPLGAPPAAPPRTTAPRTTASGDGGPRPGAAPGGPPRAARHHWILGPDLPSSAGLRYAVDRTPAPP